MKIRLLLTTALLAGGAARATDVGVSVSVGDSGFYGRIDVGTMPKPPPVVYSQPVIVETTPVAVQQAPVYLRVPPGHAKHWRKHCREYNACGQRVLFVQERWYTDVYSPQQRAERHDGDEHHGREHEHGNGHGHGKGHGDDNRQD
jgi:hypothetical protein